MTLSVVAFCGSSTWTINGILLEDPYIWVAKAVGLVLTTSQLGILVYIRRARKRLGDAAPVQLQDGAAAPAAAGVAGADPPASSTAARGGTVSVAELEAGAQ